MFRSLLVSLAGAVLLSACGVEAPEDEAAWEALEALEREAAMACANVTSSYTATAGDSVCEGYPGDYAKPNADGSCPAGYKPVAATSDILCDIAEDLLAEPGQCPAGCVDGGVSGLSTSASSRSCTVSKYRECGAMAEANELLQVE